MIPATMVTVPQATLAQVGRTDERHLPLEMLAVGQRDEVFARRKTSLRMFQRVADLAALDVELTLCRFSLPGVS